MRPSGVWPLVACVPLATACRVNFDRNAAQNDAADAPETPDAPPDSPPPTLLPCGVPPQFPVTIGGGGGSANVDNQVNGFTAIASDTAYHAFFIDTANAVHGYSYGFVGDQLVARTQNAAVRSAPSTAISAVETTPDGLLIAASYNQPGTGTALVPLDPQLASRGAPHLSDGWSSIDHALARTEDGTIALGGLLSGTQAVVQRVSPLGVPLGSAREAIAASENAQSMLVAPAGPRFLVAWQTSADMAGLRARALDTAFAEAVPTTTLNPAQKGNGPGIAYAPAVDRYLFAWWFKEANGQNDDLWISLRDGKLQELSRAQLSNTGTMPRIAVGRDGFLIVWRDGSTASGLLAARVAFDAASHFTRLPVVGHGSSALDYDVVSRAGQAAVAWLENTDTPGAATLWFNALCD